MLDTQDATVLHLHANMMTDDILRNLKDKGHRLTKIRTAVIGMLSLSNVPLSAFEIKSSLEKNRIQANKTTIYREVSFLLTNGIIHEIQFGDGRMRYKICPDDHHHHTICIRCSRVEAISMEKDMIKYEQELVRLKRFKVLRHTLEFFGICSLCND